MGGLGPLHLIWEKEGLETDYTLFIGGELPPGACDCRYSITDSEQTHVADWPDSDLGARGRCDANDSPQALGGGDTQLTTAAFHRTAGSLTENPEEEDADDLIDYRRRRDTSCQG